MTRRRTCSYCGQPGHNRRTCHTLVEDEKIVINSTNKYREALSNKFKEQGLGPGALISTFNRYKDKVEVGIVREISFDQVHPTQRGRMGKIMISNVDDMTRSSWLGFGELPSEWNTLLNRNTESYESARSEGAEYKDPDGLMTILSTVKNVNLSDFNLKSPTKYTAYEDIRIFSSFNIKPSSYREEDKYRLDLRMERTKEYLDQAGKRPTWVCIW